MKSCFKYKSSNVPVQFRVLCFGLAPNESSVRWLDSSEYVTVPFLGCPLEQCEYCVGLCVLRAVASAAGVREGPG